MHDFWLTIKTIKNGGYVIPLSLSLIKYRQHDTNVCGIKAYNHSYMNRIKNIKYSFITNKLKYKVISNVLNISLITYIKRKILIHKLMIK